MDAYSQVINARSINRKRSKEIIESLFDDIIYLKGDRTFGDSKSIIGGIASFKNIPITFIGIQKGKDIDEAVETNFGMPKPQAYRKAIRLMKQAEKFHRPVITFVDTPGAYPGVEAEERGQHQAIANSLYTLAGLEVPVLSFVIGEGGSGGALALSFANRCYMSSGAVYSVLSPEGFAAILYRDGKKAPQAAELMRLKASDLLEDGLIDGIIEDEDNNINIKEIKKIIDRDLKVYKNFKKFEIVENRYDKYRKIGK
ncbi:acetyl-CoA carboxylase carboxyl transferase subunit alpha [Peptoniphilus olsenii]|uniref:acetyl-CoA carboxytransferase n=1 Tax=Peptoniphilus olsenii TaxID=411570 RepID=A0ABV2J9F8_9FIRM